jgi:hypothetical protein
MTREDRMQLAADFKSYAPAQAASGLLNAHK